MKNDDSKQIIELLKEILKWMRISGLKEVRMLLMNTLDTEEKRMVYHLSDGRRGSIEISEATGVSSTTIRRYWRSWGRIGIMEAISVRGGLRYSKSFDLQDFGFTLPPIENTDHRDEEIGEEE